MRKASIAAMNITESNWPRLNWYDMDSLPVASEDGLLSLGVVIQLIERQVWNRHDHIRPINELPGPILKQFGCWVVGPAKRLDLLVDFPKAIFGHGTTAGRQCTRWRAKEPGRAGQLRSRARSSRGVHGTPQSLAGAMVNGNRCTLRHYDTLRIHPI